MKIKRFRQEHPEGPRGFSRWVQPAMKKYLLACCDCNLVHEMQFRVVGIKVKKVQFRVRRARNYTARLRSKRGVIMPWNPADAVNHTHKAKSPTVQRQWAAVANAELKRTGSESRAIRAANSVVAKRKKKKRKVP